MKKSCATCGRKDSCRGFKEAGCEMEESNGSCSDWQPKEPKSGGAICGDGMCPYVPCKKFPKCGHLEKQMEFERKQSADLPRPEKDGLDEIKANHWAHEDMIGAFFSRKEYDDMFSEIRAWHEGECKTCCQTMNNEVCGEVLRQKDARIKELEEGCVGCGNMKLLEVKDAQISALQQEIAELKKEVSSK